MIIYLATALIFEAAGQAALSGKSETWHIARVYDLELDTGKK